MVRKQSKNSFAPMDLWQRRSRSSESKANRKMRGHDIRQPRILPPLPDIFSRSTLANREDPTNFPPDQCPGILERYEEIFRSALDTLKLTKRAEKQIGVSARSCGTEPSANLESAIAVRTVEALRLQQFSAIRLRTLQAPSRVRAETAVRVCCESEVSIT